MNVKKLVIMASFAVGTMVSAGYALAATWYSDVLYYSDASYSVQVGERVTYCNRKFDLDGIVTPYRRTIEQYNCAYPAP